VKKQPREANLCLEKHLKELKLEFWREYKFHPDRKWKFDYLLKHGNIAIEIEGGIWTRGRHTRGQGFIDDMEKYNTATLCGFRLLRFSTQQCLDGSAKAFLDEFVVD
jgi:hypothetical protein